MFLLLAFLSFITGILVRFMHARLVPHDPITLVQASEMFLLFSIALAILDSTKDKSGSGGA